MNISVAKTIHPLVWLLSLAFLLSIPATLPLLRPDFFQMHDYTHVARLVELRQALEDGQIPGRWSDNFGYGYGMPLLHFYGPLPYYLALIPYFAGFHPVIAIKFLFWLNFFAGFLFTYLLGKEFFGRWGGLLAGVAFIYAPYRAVQFYVRGALGEMTATTCIPLALWGLYHVCRLGVEAKPWPEKLRIMWPWVSIASLGLAGVFLSHNVITLFSLPFFLLWCVFWLIMFSGKDKSLRLLKLIHAIPGILLTGLITTGFTAWFLVPAYLEKNFTIVDTISGGYSYYKLHFVYLRQFLDSRFAYGGSILGPDDDISFQFGIVQWILLLVSGLIFALLLFKPKLLKVELQARYFDKKMIAYTFGALSLFVSVFMMTFHSTFIWEALPIIHIAQFPWRFLSFSIVFISLLIGINGLLFRAIKISWLRIILFLACITLLIWFNIPFFKPVKYSSWNDYYYTDAQKIRTNMSDILRDYLPATVKTVPKPDEEPFSIIEGSGEIENFIKKTGYRSFTVHTDGMAVLEVATFYFPGWEAYIDGQKTPINISTPSGFIHVPLPAGDHQVLLTLHKTGVQKISDSLSFVIGISFICIWYWYLVQRYYKPKISGS